MSLRPVLRSPALWVLLTLLAAFSFAQDVRIARTSPELRTAPPGSTVTHVFALRGVGAVQVKLSSEHGWPILTPERRLELKPGQPAYFPVTLRVPEDARAGVRDRLTLQAGGAAAYAFTEAAYVPGLEVRWPGEVPYAPPLGRFALELANTGNGADVARVRLETLEGVPVFRARVPLGAGEQRALQVSITQTGVLRLIVRLERGDLQRSGYVSVVPATSKKDGTFRLLGRFGAAYSYPGALSFSLGAAGPLSDFTTFSVGAGYALGSTPAGTLGLSWDGGYLSAAFGPSYGLALGLGEGGVSTQIALSGPELRGSMNFDVVGRGYGFGASAILSSDPSLKAYTEVATGREGHKAFRPGTLAASMTFRPFQSELSGELSYGFGYHGWPVRLQSGFRLLPAAPVLFQLSADTNPRSFGLGGRLAWTGEGLNDWGLAATSNSERLGLDLPVPVSFGAAAGSGRLRVFAQSTLDLPAPWSNLRAEAQAAYASGRWEFSLGGGSEATPPEGLTTVRLGGRVGWPLDQNELNLGLRASNSYLRTRADLTWAPWKPSFQTTLSLELPAGGTLLRARADREWYHKRTRLELGADLPLVLAVPPAVTRFFGGRNVGTILGEVQLEGPDRLREGIVVRAGAYETRTDSQGRFRLEVPPGRYTVEVDGTKLPATLVPVRGAAEVEVALKQTVRITLTLAVRSVLKGQVRVVSEPGREVAPQRFAIQIEDPRGRTTSLLTEPGGAFTVPALPPGHYIVRLLVELLPPGWEAIKTETAVELLPGEVGRAELAVRPPARKVFAGSKVQILQVQPEADRVPPGSAPLVEVQLRGAPRRVAVTLQGRLVGLLVPVGEEAGVWRGRVHVPASASGTLALEVEAVNGEVARFPFFVSVSPDAPWGVVRSLPVARPGQKLQVAVHWYAPVKESWLEVEGERVDLSGSGSDWQGTLTVPESVQNRWSYVAKARLGSGRVVEITKPVLIRKD